MIIIDTNFGKIQLDLFDKQAPITTKNFLNYIDLQFYNGTIFHRVIKGFMIQGGGFTQNMEQKPTQPPIKNEANHKLSNKKYTIAMARTSDIHSATNQFFINTNHNTSLDYQNESNQGWGYCVFGKVVDGFDIVDKIELVNTNHHMGHDDVPTESISMKIYHQK